MGHELKWTKCPINNLFILVLFIFVFLFIVFLLLCVCGGLNWGRRAMGGWRGGGVKWRENMEMCSYILNNCVPGLILGAVC